MALTDAQVKALDLLYDGTPVPRFWWRGRYGMPSHSTRKALLRKGYIQQADGWKSEMTHITPAGRKALEEARK